jgi:adenylylsulfate kinase-like enzyme
MTIIAAEEALYFRYHGSGLAGLGKVTIAANLERLLPI